MPFEISMLAVISVVFIIAGIALKISAETGEMVLIEHMKADWKYRLPFHLKNNRYRGANRPSYQLLAILYYIIKSIVIIALCGYYYILAGVIIAIKWIWKTIGSLRSTETTNTGREDDLETIMHKITKDQEKNHVTVRAQPSYNTTHHEFAGQPAAVCENAISSLWNHGSEIAWKEALDYYYQILRVEELALDRYMESIDADEIAQMPVDAFYAFLYDEYFVWKYTAKNRLATTRKSLRWYMEENRLSELAGIQKSLFSADHEDIEKCLSIAAGIRGLGTAGASGLLSILFPKSFGTIDQYVVRALREVEGLPYEAELAKMNPDSLNIKNGALLIRILREQAARLNQKYNTDFWTPRKIDMVFWAFGRVRK